MKKRLLSLLILVLAVIMPMKLWAQEPYAVLSEDSTVLTFYYDNQKAARNGMSVGPFSGYPDYQTWYAQRESITSVVFDDSFAGCTTLTSTAYWFYLFENLTSITGISNLKTDNMTDMHDMFADCSSLTSLDVTSFKTDNVTNMSEMFYRCSSLTSLDVSGFKTDNVTDVSGMFGWCSGLTSLDVSGFKTDNVTDMSGMFWGCSGLTTLDVSGFNTEKVTNMWVMFSDCSGLTSLDVSGFKTDNVTNMREMFYRCSSLMSLDVSGFKTDNVTNMSEMFYRCSSLTSLDVSGFKTDNVTNMCDMFYWCSGLTSLDVGGFKTDNVTNMSGMFGWCSGLTSLDVSGFKTDNVTDMGAMFYGCYGLTSLDVSGFNTDNVTNMRDMFYVCTGLTSLDVSGFKTDNVTDMNRMFADCQKLTSLDLGSFKTDNVTNMQAMFDGCSGLKTIYVGSTWSTSAVTEGSDMFGGCTKIVGGQGTTYDADHIDATYARIDGGPTSETPGYFTRSGDAPYVVEAYAVLSEDSTVLTFYYDGQKATRGGININNSNLVDAPSPYGTATSAVFDASFANYYPTSTAYWFQNCSALTSISGIENLKTNNVTDMAGMFYYCSGLTSLDVSGFKTANVTSMYCMFWGCSGLTSLNVSGFNTDKVEDMGGMFVDCSSLTSLDVSGFNTANVTGMNSMFADCSSLTSLDLSGFNTANVTDMGYVFRGCSALTSLDVSSYKTEKVTNMYGMFWGCSGLTSLDLSGFNTSNVTDMTYMFIGCSGLKTIYVGNDWSTASVIESILMFSGCTNLVGGMGTVYNPDHIDATYAHIDGGTSNPGYLTQALAKGDANGDGSINIADAVATVTNILGQPTDGNFYKYAADMNSDSVVDIFDVTMIVNAAFEAATPAPAFTRGNIDHVSAEAIRLMADAHHVYMGVDQAQQYTAFQFDIDLPEGTELADVRLSGNTDHQLSFVKRGENQYRVVALSMKNEVFRPTNGHLIQLQVSNMAGEDQVKVSNMLFVTPAGKTITGISDCLNATMTNDDAIYNLQGEKLGTNKQQLGKGIYIINHKKVIIK